MRIADAALLLVDALGGVEVGTEQDWKFAHERNLPVMIYINKMDRENADFEQVVSQLPGNQVRQARCAGADTDWQQSGFPWRGGYLAYESVYVRRQHRTRW